MGRKEMNKEKAKENYKRTVNEKSKEKITTRWKPIFCRYSRTSKNGGWLTTTDLMMCPQHLYLGSSTPITTYPMYVSLYLLPELDMAVSTMWAMVGPWRSTGISSGPPSPGPGNRSALFEPSTGGRKKFL